jgi:hypothetical protein
MRTETYTRTFAKFGELTKEQQEKAIENTFSNCPFHYEHCMQERIGTLKGLAEHLGGHLDYSISCVPDRGEFIKITHELSSSDLQEMIDLILDKDCPLTGVCYDHDIIDAIVKNDYSLQKGLNVYLKSIHDEYESMLGVEYISDLCDANDYEFDLDSLTIA